MHRYELGSNSRIGSAHFQKETYRKEMLMVSMKFLPIYICFVHLYRARIFAFYLSLFLTHSQNMLYFLLLILLSFFYSSFFFHSLHRVFFHQCHFTITFKQTILLYVLFCSVIFSSNNCSINYIKRKFTHTSNREREENGD